MRLMASIRAAVVEDRLPLFIKEFMKKAYPDEKYPSWVVDALAKVNVQLEASTA